MNFHTFKSNYELDEGFPKLWSLSLPQTAHLTNFNHISLLYKILKFNNTVDYNLFSDFRKFQSPNRPFKPLKF